MMIEKRIAIVLLVCILLSGCSHGSASKEQRKDVLENRLNKQSVTKTKNQLLLSDFQKSCSGLDIGSSNMDVLRTMGETQKTGYYGGTFYRTYNGITFFMESPSANAKVEAITLSGARPTGYTKIGLLPSDLKKLLGKPEYEGVNEEDGLWGTSYQIGNRLIVFYSEKKDTPTIMVFSKQFDPNEGRTGGRF